MIYLDHGATSFPKPKGVIEEMDRCMRYYCGNPGRSGHKLSMLMGEGVYETRKRLAGMLGITDPSRLVFTKNTTEALNLALFGFLQEGDHVVTTSMEHNSVLRPLAALEGKGVSHTIVKGDREGQIRVADIEAVIQDNTKLIAVTAASNVTGTLLPIEDISRLAREKEIPLLIDGAQTVGKFPLHMEKLQVSFFAFPGHKGLLGPMGTGGLYVAQDIELKPLVYGGTGTRSFCRHQPLDLPEGFEAGTVNGPGLIGLGKALEALERIGVETIAHYERQLIGFLEEALRNMKYVTCYGPQLEKKTGICLFNINSLSSEEVTERLSREFAIAVRGGYHCAGLAHKTIGTAESGAVRLSVGPFNTRKEMRAATEAIWRISKEVH